MKNSPSLTLSQTTKPIVKNLTFIGGVLFFAGTCYFLSLWIAGATEMLLVPWDTSPLEIRPASGTVMREINDFFEVGVGTELLGVVVLTIIGIIFLVRLKRDADKFLVPFELALTNAVFIVSSLLGSIFSIRLMHLILPEFDPPYHAGYHDTGLGIVVMLGLLITLFWVQYRGLIPIVRDFVAKKYGQDRGGIVK